jgi:hypothetical protein
MATQIKPTPAGRPRKYAEPSSPITVTLPDRILNLLERVDIDRGKAIVKCVEAQTASANPSKRIDIVKAAEGSAIIIVSSRHHLEKIPWLRLLEIAPSRFLLAMPSGTDVTSLEVALLDLLEHLPDDADDRLMLEELRHHLTHHRRKNNVSKGQILFVDL